MVGLAITGIGVAYRTSRRDGKIALMLIATGLFVEFTLVASTFNYLLLPLPWGANEAWFAQMDEWIGFHWPSYVAWIVSIPYARNLLLAIYVSSLPQLVAMILTLGIGGHARSLHLFLLTGVFGSLMSIAIWSVVPSVGAAAHYILPEELSKAAALLVDNSYALKVTDLIAEGAFYISPREALGLIGFPSFHMVMACMAVWFSYGHRWLFLPLLLINLLMIPAILFHGGHHVMDVIGGVVVFGLCLAASIHILRYADHSSHSCDITSAHL
ncbi:phosphatase PAP2 family protein [Limoniibacter endophyticus]|nr:phosphatase PAP2 family protein [Limoniibacter endophyticus]